jgi:hypothetical protein
MQRVFGIGTLVVENNLIELAIDSDGEIGIHVHDDALSPQAPDHVHDCISIRGNKLRYLDGQFDSGYAGSGIQIGGAKSLIVSNNVVELAPADPLQDFRCGAVTYFNNKSPAGALIQGLNGDSQTKYSELETEAEDALVLTLL